MMKCSAVPKTPRHRPNLSKPSDWEVAIFVRDRAAAEAQKEVVVGANTVFAKPGDRDLLEALEQRAVNYAIRIPAKP